MISPDCFTNWEIPAQDIGDYSEARQLHQESLKILQELGDKSGISGCASPIGNLAYLTGDYYEAGRLYQKSLNIKQELGIKAELRVRFTNWECWLKISATTVRPVGYTRSA